MSSPWSFLDVICGPKKTRPEFEDIIDADAARLSKVGLAAYEVLRTQYEEHHLSLWNVTTGKIVGDIHQTPKVNWPETHEDPPADNDLWFPDKLGEIIRRTESWCDLMSLGPPDGLFMTRINEALVALHEKAASNGEEITIRMMFGNIIGMPVNCNKVIKSLTKGIPKDTNIRLWVGAWRRGVSWNHAKIIAVDGRYLHTGGHNLWHAHYLKNDPVHDLSLEMEGKVAYDGHTYCNKQWAFIEHHQSSYLGWFIDKLPDGLPMLVRTRVTVSEFPKSVATEYPPVYSTDLTPKYDEPESVVPIISLGRYGEIYRTHRPSDDAIVAMLDSAENIIHFALQDIGPVCIPGTKIALPGCTWPKHYLDALARVMWLKGVDVEILLSNPGSVPGNLSGTEACYGNGWSCADVASELIKRIRAQFPDAKDDDLRKKVEENLRICFIKHQFGSTFSGGQTVGMHAKHFIIDDKCSYIGSQNLYVCDLAEWGVVIDHEEQTKRIMAEYWSPMWDASFKGIDCDVNDVMDGLDIDRDGEDPATASEETKRMMVLANGVVSGNKEYYTTEEEQDKSIEE